MTPNGAEMPAGSIKRRNAKRITLRPDPGLLTTTEGTNMNEAKRLAKAKAAYEAASAETDRLRKEAEEKIKEAEAVQRAAFMEMESAQMAADKLLPTCVMHSTFWRSGNHEKSSRCIVKMTKKTVFVKMAGQPDDSAQQFRLGNSGKLEQYPKADAWASKRHWIELPEESPSAADPA